MKLDKRSYTLIEVGYGEGKVEFVRGRRVGGMWEVWVRKMRKRIIKSREENVGRRGNNVVLGVLLVFL